MLAVNRAADPTHTTDLRQRFFADFARRWGKVRTNAAGRLAGGGLAGVQAFWGSLYEDMENEVIAGGAWMGAYMRPGYIRGRKRADLDLKAARIKIPQESSAQKQLIRQAADNEIARKIQERSAGARDITGEVLNQVAAIPGDLWGSEDYQTTVDDRLRKIGLTRSRALAATAVIDIFAIGTLDRLGGLGFTRVSIIPEVIFTTAGDSRVCPFCKEWEEDSFDIFKARGLIPRHPFCRCRWTLDLGFLAGQALTLSLLPSGQPNAG